MTDGGRRERNAHRRHAYSGMKLSIFLKRPIIAVLSISVLWPLLAWLGARLLIVKKEIPSADAIVVLSGSATYLERADWAAKLYREGRAPVIVITNDGLISGWSRSDERNLHLYELAINELARQGVPVNRVQVVPEIVTGTYQESSRLCDYATTHKMNRLLVVTSAYHSRRALWSMRRACTNLEIGIDGPPPGLQTPSPGFWWLHKLGWRVVAGEYVKLVYYGLAY
jgi:uncharacterized SAM-binding protein YcdF (DUF218 family)